MLNLKHVPHKCGIHRTLVWRVSGTDNLFMSTLSLFYLVLILVGVTRSLILVTERVSSHFKGLLEDPSPEIHRKSLLGFCVYVRSMN